MALYLPEMYNPEIYNQFDDTENNDITNEKFPIEIVRIRHFFEFDSTLILKKTEEITFFNHGEAVTSIQYLPREFLPHLNIFDFDGKPLIFHGDYYNKYTHNRNSCTLNQHEFTDELSDNPIPDSIIIEFPQNDKVEQNHFRTIVLDYILDADVDEKKIIMIDIPIGICPHFYLYIKKLEQYKTEIFAYIKSNDNQYFGIGGLEEIDAIEIDDTRTYFSMASSIPIEKCTLSIVLINKLQSPTTWWLDGGIVFAIGAIIGNMMMLLSDPHQYLTAIIALGGVSNSYLVITKGWIFMKDMDRILKTPYTYIYLCLILIILFEMILAIIIVFSNFDISQKTYLLVDQQLKMNISFVKLL